MALKFECEHCGKENVVSFLEKGAQTNCKFCGKTTTIPESAESVNPQEAVSQAELNARPAMSGALKFDRDAGKGATAAVILKVLAWLTIIGSGLFAILLLLVGIVGTSEDPELLGVYLVYVFILLIPGIAMGVLYLVASYGLEHLIAIRKNLSKDQRA